MTSSNARKHATGNPVVRALIDRFHGAVRDEVAALRPTALLDVGCGEGFVLEALSGVYAEADAIDLSSEAVAACQARNPSVRAQVGSVLALPFEDNAFDVVICLEVLEHLEQPQAAVAELSRVCRGQLVLSVPWEPWFQLGNLARGQYLDRMGNHPEHIQRWTPGGFRKMLNETGSVGVDRVRTSFPWTIAVATPVAAD